MDYPLHLMLLVPIVTLIVYHLIPILGISISFLKYYPAKGFLGSKWVGLSNYITLFTMPGFLQAIRNTLVISIWKIVLGILVPVTFTLFLNEIGKKYIKRGIQTLIYLPHFISWVALAGIFVAILKSTGMVNQILGALGVDPIIFLGDNNWFPFTIITTHIWKEFGYGTVVYLAAVTGVSKDLYEAAEIDGASRIKQVWHVTIPGIIPIVILMSVLSLGNILNGGFDQVFNMYSPAVYKTGEILDTLVYRMAFEFSNFSLSTAAGVFKSVVACLLIVGSHKIAYKTSGYRVF